MARAWLVALLVSGAALGGERVRVAVHPIVGPGIDDPKLLLELNREVQNLLAATEQVTLVGAEDVDRRLAEEGGRCALRGKERTECLERVALATRAVYAVAVVVKRLGHEYELSATLVCADRVMLPQPDSISATDSGAVKVEAMLKHQLRVLLLERLKMGALPGDPRALAPAPVDNPPVVLVTSPPPETTTPTLRVAAYGAVGFAVLAGAAGVGLAVVASDELKAVQSPDGRVLASNDDVARVVSSRNKATIGAAMGSVAGAAALAAVVLFIISPASEPKIAVAPMVGEHGGGVAVTGRFP